jgi:endonuclease/exonuclease/phosphatase family metal-dependent hydrolase
MKKQPYLDKLFYFLNIVFAILLLLSYLLPFISPKSIPAFAVLSLLVPFLIIINLIFFVYWLLKLKKHVFLSALTLIIGWFFSTPLYQFSEKNDSLNSDIRVMSYNVRMFNYYQWNKDATIAQKTSTFIKEKNPDILAIQEHRELKEISDLYAYKYVKKKSPSNKFGLAIYSKYKIIHTGSLDFKHTINNAIFTDVLVAKDTIRIYNLHLESLGINPKKENFGEENSEKLFKRIRNSFKKQAIQTEQFISHEKNFKGKKIICGDFNNTAYSWVYKQISRNKKDAFLEAGKGFGKSFNYGFPVRIDFILTDENAIINQFKTFPVKYSDHFPILAKINWHATVQ